MSDTTRTLAPPGWFDDPQSSELIRWWDGTQWTVHTQPRPLAQPALPQAVVSQPVAPQSFAPRAPAPAPVEFEPEPERYVPMQRIRQPEPLGAPSSGMKFVASTSTLPIWLLALYPVPYVLGFWMLFSTGLLALAILVVVVNVLQWVLAIWDYFTLKGRGFDAGSPVWMLLGSIAYLIARWVALKREGARAGAPGLLFAIGLVASGIISGAFAATSMQPAFDNVLVNQFEKELAIEMAQQMPGTWTFECPDDAAVVTPGSAFACQGTDALGNNVEVNVSVLEGGRYSFSARVV